MLRFRRLREHGLWLLQHLRIGYGHMACIVSGAFKCLKTCVFLSSGRIVGNLVQLRVQFILDNGAGVYSLVSRNFELKDIHQFDGFGAHLDPTGSRKVILMDWKMDEELDTITHYVIELVEHLNQMNGLNKDRGNILLDELQIAFLLAQFVSDHFRGQDESLMVERARKSAFGSTKII
ncbi:hypothetical protein Tco_0105175 [Tanacetum coccineum]